MAAVAQVDVRGEEPPTSKANNTSRIEFCQYKPQGRARCLYSGLSMPCQDASLLASIPPILPSMRTAMVSLVTKNNNCVGSVRTENAKANKSTQRFSNTV